MTDMPPADVYWSDLVEITRSTDLAADPAEFVVTLHPRDDGEAPLVFEITRDEARELIAGLAAVL